MTEDLRLLVVEDDREMAQMLAELLGDEGYAVEVAHDGQRGLHLALSRRYPLMVIDRGLPGIDGLDLLTRLRRVGVTARVLMLTALSDPEQRVRGLDAGADDYLGKPFDIGELLARVRALHRRHLDRAEALPLPHGELDLARREVRRPDTVIALSGREFELLRLLAGAPRTVFPRAELRARVFADTSAESIVDTYVYYLRRKLGRATIRTVHGVGYRIGSA
ncbi:response regulator transcription factor [Streptomyces sp. SL13]|uniref:Response regulator transcription factor n=1 Tax=Streptantibioticus silvisoli TaxID=2705255 RepID=A0AA90KIH0_9ACTN|nr:response regulator transcription factor [Streptantibioticus silvisoli]MDI5965593.1 response regulator transcription factor [Streptantibioticus silvisoli]MDI5972614.1 response regulator transcription factor [Streptantibioticus silvisoli]